MTPEERKIALRELYAFIHSPDFYLILEQIVGASHAELYDTDILESALIEFQALAEEQVYRPL